MCSEPTLRQAGRISTWRLFLTVLLLHMLCYMPTIGLTNTVAFANMTDQEKQFPLVRVWGTIGWIVANIVVSLGLWAVVYYVFGSDPDLVVETTRMPFFVAGAAAILMGFYSFTLPHTPPPLAGKKVSIREVIGLDAVVQLSSKPFWVFILASLLLCIPLATYYAYAGLFVTQAGIAYPVFHMSFGQMSEVLFMLLMPLAFRYLGVKWMLLIGMLAWVLRYALFALGAPDQVYWMILVGIILHGVCYDFFFVTGMVYVEKKASPAIRAQAQGFLVTMTLGVGMFIGMILMGEIYNVMIEGTTGEERMDQYQLYWFIPAGLAAVVMVGFAMLFYDPRVEEQVQQAEASDVQPPGDKPYPPSDAELPP
jgi:nucleoside transporter